MDKARREDPDIADEYDFSKAVPNPYAERMKDGFTVRIVSDEKHQQRRSLIRASEAQGGVPVFAGTHVPVQILFDYLETDGGVAGFLQHHPTVSRDQALGVLEQARQALLGDRA